MSKSIYQQIYDLHKKLDKLPIDIVLVKYEQSHYKYRKWLVANNHKLYKPTSGLIQELLLDDQLSPAALARKYKLTPSEVSKILSNPTPKEDYSNIIPPSELAKAVIKDLYANKLSQQTIADKHNITQARVSQIKNKYLGGTSKKVRAPLTEGEKIAILMSKESVSTIAKQFDVTVNTVYKVRRECKNLLN